jgi:hypothetical protein
MINHERHEPTRKREEKKREENFFENENGSKRFFLTRSIFQNISKSFV